MRHKKIRIEMVTLLRIGNPRYTYTTGIHCSLLNRNVAPKKKKASLTLIQRNLRNIAKNKALRVKRDSTYIPPDDSLSVCTSGGMLPQAQSRTDLIKTSLSNLKYVQI